MRKIISIATAATVAAILLAAVPSLAKTGRARAALFSSTWYLELDTTPFGLPGGTLPTLASFHRYGTLNMSDGGDFGGPPISTLHSPMYGSWERVAPRTFETTNLFMEADLAGVLLNITKVHLTLQFQGNDFDHLTGFADIEVVPCDPDGPTPFQTLNCPNPITTPGIPAGAGIPVQLTRLPYERPSPYLPSSNDDFPFWHRPFDPDRVHSVGSSQPPGLEQRRKEGAE